MLCYTTGEINRYPGAGGDGLEFGLNLELLQ